MQRDDDIVSFTATAGRENLKRCVGGVSLAERRAAKFGRSADVERFHAASPLAAPAMRSPCLTIPAGLSPSALLDSPMMLPNNKALLSPTTGSLSFSTFHHQECDIPGMDGNLESFSYKHYTEEMPRSTSASEAIEVTEPPNIFDQLSLDYELPTEYAQHYPTDYPENLSEDVKPEDNVAIDIKPLKTVMSQDVAGEEDVTPDASEGNNYGYFVSNDVKEDVYNWRKYGQKQVKGSEYPRSYYKCTNPNCPVKKKVERSLDGHITEIIYKGNHNHPTPQPNRRSASYSSFNEASEVNQGNGSVRADGFEIASSASIVSDLSEQPFAANYSRSMYGNESGGTPELSSTMASHDDDEDRATHGSLSMGEGDESESKRRKRESCIMETAMLSRAVREPRVVVQIQSEIDILDDGYRWRKYGQKVVKGNPNPRSYYKCTSTGCTVRKHVERASHDLKCVITTYEGKHNHEVPAARNGNHMNSGGSHAAATGPSTVQQTPALPRNHIACKTDMQIPELATQFDRKPNFGSEYLHPGFTTSFGNGSRYGNLSMYPMNYPTMQSTIPYTSFSRQHIMQDYALPIPPPRTLGPPGNLSIAGLSFNGGKLSAPVQPLPQNDVRFFRPKQEQSDNYDVYSSSVSTASSYNRISGGFQ